MPPLPMPSAFPRVKVPSCAVCAKRFVELAVVEKRFVVVPEVSESVPRVESPLTKVVPKVPVLAFAFVEVAVAKYPIPEAVMLVVEAPPLAEKRPLVIVDDAFERKPPVKVARPV